MLGIFITFIEHVNAIFLFGFIKVRTYLQIHTISNRLFSMDFFLTSYWFDIADK